MDDASIIGWWSQNALKEIRPNRNGAEFPEGKEVFDQLVASVGEGSVLEIGCGRGRLAPLFNRSLYTGVDLCKSAIETARARNPGYRFIHTDSFWACPNEFVTDIEAVFLCSVAIHLPERILSDLLRRLRPLARRLCISEIMDPTRLKMSRVPPTINRSPEHLSWVMLKAGWDVVARVDAPCLCYQNVNMTCLTAQ